MFFIVGLGNPGPTYKKSRHNVGFMVVDYLSDEYHIPIHQKNNDFESGSGLLLAEKVLLVKPATFMNRSGLAVKEILDYFDEKASQLIVIHDDLDLPLGKIRIKLKGGAGGHHGLTSIIDSIHTNIFLRIRVGVGRPIKKEDVTPYLLSPFLKSEKVILNEAIKRAAEAIREVLLEGPHQAMSLYNQKK